MIFYLAAILQFSAFAYMPEFSILSPRDQKVARGLVQRATPQYLERMMGSSAPELTEHEIVLEVLNEVAPASKLYKDQQIDWIYPLLCPIAFQYWSKQVADSPQDNDKWIRAKERLKSCICHSQVSDWFFEQLSSSKNEFHRVGALFFLVREAWKIGAIEKTFNAISRAFQEDSSEEVRKVAYEALSRLNLDNEIKSISPVFDPPHEFAGLNYFLKGFQIPALQVGYFKGSDDQRFMLVKDDLYPAEFWIAAFKNGSEIKKTFAAAQLIVNFSPSQVPEVKEALEFGVQKQDSAVNDQIWFKMSRGLSLHWNTPTVKEAFKKAWKSNSEFRKEIVSMYAERNAEPFVDRAGSLHTSRSGVTAYFSTL